MSKYGISLRVISFFTLISLLTTTYVLTSRSDALSIEHFKTAAAERWNYGLYLLTIPSPNSQLASKSTDDLIQLINVLIEAKMADSKAQTQSVPIELKKRQTSNNPLTALLSGLSSLSPTAASSAGSNMASGFSGLLSSLSSGISDSLLSSIGGASSALGEGISQGTIDGLKLPKKVGVQPKPQTGVKNITEVFGEGLSSTLTSEVDTSALFSKGTFGMSARSFAAGLSNGTAMGTKLTNLNVAPSENATDFPAIIGNFGFGLSNTLFSYIDLNSAVSPQSMQVLMQQVGAAVVPAASGLGMGAAQGLKLTILGAPDPGMQIDPNNVQVPAVAHDFTYTLASSFLGAVDPAMLTSPEMTAMLQAKALGALPGIGAGLGSGAASGLGLSKATMTPGNAPPPTDINSGTQDFSYSLSSSFLGSLDIEKIAAIASSAPAMPAMLGAAAEGLGKGLGEGTAIGLGLRADMPLMPVNDTDMSAVTEAFSRNLVVSFLANGTLQTLSTELSSLSAAAPSLKVSQVAEGFGRGLVDGVQTGLRMSAPLDTFDDSLMGGSLGLGKGLGESSIGLVMGVISGNPSLSSALGLNATTLPAPAPALPAPATDSPLAAPAPVAGTPPADGTAPPASVGGMAPDMLTPSPNMPMSSPMFAGDTPNPVPVTKHKRQATILHRQDMSSGTTAEALSGFSDGLQTLNISAVTEILLANLNVTAIDVTLQKGLNALTCVGFGGIVALNKGLQNSGTVKASVTPSKVPGFGNTTFRVVGERGNVFEVSPGLGLIKTNGVTLQSSVALLSIHAVAGTIGFFVIFPIVLMLSGAHDITRMIGRPQIMENSPRIQFLTQVVGFVPILVVCVITGIIVLGNGPHFNTPHKGFGYFLALFGLIWVPLSRANNASPNPGPAKLANKAIIAIILLFSLIAIITGWNDLATISNCLTQQVSADAFIGLGMLSSGMFASALGVMGLVFLMSRWIGLPVSERVRYSGGGGVKRLEMKSPTPTARELRRISGPFLPEARDYL